MTTIDDFLVRKDALGDTRFRQSAIAALDDGAALLAVDRFALTANNVTYAAFGDAMSYWNFFPTGEPAWGIVPVWGFGTVVASRAEGVDVGERFYGYFPMSTHVVVQPQRVRPAGFVDGAPHREALHPLYNQYVRNAGDPLYDADREALQLLFRPLFITSFAIDDLLADRDFFGVRMVIVSSASSKTAYGLAWQLSLRRPAGPEVVALTSPGNAAFVAGLGCYDRVVTYDDVASLPAGSPAVYVDFAGDRRLRSAVHRHFGDALHASLAVGSSHHDAERVDSDEPLPGARPTFFFAPERIRQRAADWGADGFAQRFAAAWHAFIGRVDDPARPLLSVVAETGSDAVRRAYLDFHDGRARANEGRIVSMIGAA